MTAGFELPSAFVADGLALAKGAQIFGKRFEDMTRDELIAAAAQGWIAHNRVLEYSSRSMMAVRDLHRAAERV